MHDCSTTPAASPAPTRVVDVPAHWSSSLSAALRLWVNDRRARGNPCRFGELQGLIYELDLLCRKYGEGPVLDRLRYAAQKHWNSPDPRGLEQRIRSGGYTGPHPARLVPRGAASPVSICGLTPEQLADVQWLQAFSKKLAQDGADLSPKSVDKGDTEARRYAAG